MTERLHRLIDRHPIVTALIVLVLVAVPGYVRLEQISRGQDRLLECIADWSTDTADRQTLIGELDRQREDALDRLVRTMPSRFASPPFFRRVLGEYIETSNAYQRAYDDNPVPEPVTSRCEEYLR